MSINVLLKLEQSVLFKMDFSFKNMERSFKYQYLYFTNVLIKY